MASRILVLCARGSGRALLAGSLLHAMTAHRFEIWSTPVQDAGEQAQVASILQEHATPLLSPDRLIRPTVGLHWDEGIILCSGLSAT